MDELKIKYALYANAFAPRPIRPEIGGWSGTDEKMVDGANPQPWHCLPYIEGNTCGLELVYQFETPCDVVNDNGVVRFEWDFAKEPGGILTGFEFLFFSPARAAKYYLFNSRIDVMPPPGYALRIEPHPRYFTADSDTFPLAMYAHLQSEWYPRLLSMAFRAPRPGQRHLFRKGEPYAQVLCVPRKLTHEPVPMSPAEEKQRRELERIMTEAKSDIADHNWRHPDGVEFNNHYKLLARAFARDGMPGVEAAIHAAMKKRALAIPPDKTFAEYLAMGRAYLSEQKYEHAHRAYLHALRLEPNNPAALAQMGICFANFGGKMDALELMAAAVAAAPREADYRWNLAELQRELGRFGDAEATIRTVLALTPNDAGAMCFLGLVLILQGNLAEGLAAYRSAASYPFAGVHVQIGDALAKHGAPEARACYEAALALDPSFAPAQQGLRDLTVTAIRASEGS